MAQQQNLYNELKNSLTKCGRVLRCNGHPKENGKRRQGKFSLKLELRLYLKLPRCVLAYQAFVVNLKGVVVVTRLVKYIVFEYHDFSNTLNPFELHRFFIILFCFDIQDCQNLQYSETFILHTMVVTPKNNLILKNSEHG